MALPGPTLPISGPTGFPPAIGMMFPPTWVVIDNGTDASDAAVSEAIVTYLQAKFPPLLARRVVVPPGKEPDPFDLMAHGVIVVGSPGANAFLEKYVSAMDPTFDKTTGAWRIVKKAPPYETSDPMACLITSCPGMFPWLSVWLVAGIDRAATAQAGELFCAGETKGVWVNRVKQADP